MYTLEFFKAHRKIKLNIAGCVGIVCQIEVIVKTIIVLTKAKGAVPFHSSFFPEFIPLHLFTWLNKELHFHLLELTHSENKLTRYNLIAKCFSNLCYSKRNFHSSRFLYVKKVYKYSLCCFRTQINLACIFSQRPDFSREHQIELTYIGPVFCAGYR